jgi:hypothetical protein
MSAGHAKRFPAIPQADASYPRCGRAATVLGPPPAGSLPLCGEPCLWGAPACMAHITNEELEARRKRRPSFRDLVGSAEPACWTWAVPAILPVLPSEDAARDYLLRWQEFLCAICGGRYPEVTDHDHKSGLIRGELCRSCNLLEARADAPRFQNYRERNPGSILGIRILYWDPFNGEAQPVPEPSSEEAQANARALQAAVDRLDIPGLDMDNLGPLRRWHATSEADGTHFRGVISLHVDDEPQPPERCPHEHWTTDNAQVCANLEAGRRGGNRRKWPT